MNRPLRLVAAAAISASLLGPIGTLGPAAGDAPASISGVLLDTRGAPAAGATVELALVPPAAGNADAPIVPRKFAETRTDGDGRFSLDGIPSGLAKVRETEGLEIMVSGLLGDQGVYHSLIAYPPTNSEGRWTRETGSKLEPLLLQFGAGEVSETGPLGRLGAEGGGDARSLAAPSSMASLASTFGSGVPVEPAPATLGAPVRNVAPRAAAAATRTCREGYAVTYVAQDKYQKRFVPIQRLRTRKHSTMQYEFDTNTKTELQVAFTGEHGNYAGGFTHSREEQNSIGMKWPQGNNRKHVLRPQWEFRNYRAKCYSTGGGDYSLRSYWTDSYQWRPNRFTTGGKIVESEATWKCAAGKTVRMPVETWVAKSSVVGWADWFSVGPVKMDAKQTNTSNHKLTVTPDKGERAPRICGDNGYPDQASRIKERTSK